MNTRLAAPTGAGRRIMPAVVFGFGLVAYSMESKGPATDSFQTEWRLAAPVSYENLSLFPILARGGGNATAYATLDEAIAAGEAVVAERGGDMLHRSRGAETRLMQAPAGTGAEVNRLVLVYRGPKPLMLLAGEVVTGGKQDRVIAKDRIVPPGAEPLPLDVFCVERGRWAGPSAQFTAAKLMAHPSVREKAAVDQNQHEVWAAVRSGSARAQAEPAGMAADRRTDGSGPGAAGVVGGIPGGVLGGVVGGVISGEVRSESYARIYQSRQVSGAVDSLAEEIARRFTRATAGLKAEQVVGVVVAYGGEIAWADAFASAALFDRYWMKLLRSYVVEALARPSTQERPSIVDAREFLKPLAGHETVESEPAVYRWRQVSQARHSEIWLEAVGPKAMMLHWCKVARTNG